MKKLIFILLLLLSHDASADTQDRKKVKVYIEVKYNEYLDQYEVKKYSNGKLTKCIEKFDKYLEQYAGKCYKYN